MKVLRPGSLTTRQFLLENFWFLLAIESCLMPTTRCEARGLGFRGKAEAGVRRDFMNRRDGRSEGFHSDMT